MEGRFFKDKLSVLGNVGIGTTSSRGPLEVHAASDSTLIIERYTSNGIQLRADNSVNSAIRLGFEAYTYEFKNGSGTSRLHIDANGNVGIGTVTPSQKLHVQGSLRVTGAYYDSNNESGTSDQVLTSTGSGTDWKSLSDIGDTVTGCGTTNYVTKWCNGPNSDLTDSIIYDNGTNVGISTASPSEKLHVFSSSDPTIKIGGGVSEGTTGGTSTLQWWANNGSVGNVISATYYKDASNDRLTFIDGGAVNILTLKNGGNVGIGTTSPNDKLEIHGNMRVRGSDGFGANTTASYNPSYVAYPGGGKAGSSSGTQAGYIKITLPQSWTSTMMQFSVDVFEYQDNKAKTFVLAGYNYSPSGGSWFNTSAMVLAGNDGATYKVQFGHDGSKCAIYISKGTSGASSSWVYPFVVVRDASFSFNSIQLSNWIDGWDVSFTTATLSGITSTRDISTQVTGTGTSQYIPKWNSTGTALGDSVIVQDSNNIGIGTASPSAKLHIFSGTDTIPQFKMFGANADGIRISMGVDDADDVASIYAWDEDDGSNAAFADLNLGVSHTSSLHGVFICGSNQNVGIGTTSPSTLLTIHQTSNTSTGGLRIENSDNSSAFRVWKQPSGGASVLVDDGVDTLFLKNGNVGIGTDNPTTKLEIFGGQYSSNYPSMLNIVDDETAFSTNNNGGGISFGANYASGTIVRFIAGIQGVKENNTSGNYGGALRFSVRENGTSLLSEKMRVASTGKVGIGTNNPIYKLHVFGSGFTESSLKLQRTDAGTNNDPNIIFTANSSANTSVALGGLWYQNAVDNNYNAIIRARTDNNAGTSGRLDFVTGIAVSNSTVPSMVIKGDGNVGIGTATPAYGLDVKKTSIRTTSRTAEKDFSVGFSNATANQKVDISFPYFSATGFWGYLEVTLTSSYSSQLSTGKMTKLFAVGLNPPTGTSGNYTAQIYDNTNYYTSVYGAIASQWGIEGINFNTTSGQYYITIAHRVSTANGLRIKVKAFADSSAMLESDIFGGLSAGSVYTTDTTAFDAPVIEMTGLDLHEVSGVDNKLRFHNSTTGYGTSNGSRIGLNGAELLINNIENNAIKIYTQCTQTNGITILGDGNVGIGTASPTQKLVVNGNNTNALFKSSGTSGVDAGIEIRGGRNGTVDDETSYIHFTNYDDNASPVGVHNLGRIYGSMASAQGRDGTITIEGFDGTSYQHGLTVDENGLVGIGTTSPGSYFGSGNTLVIANTASSAGITIVSNTANSGNIYFSDGTSGSDRTRGLVGYNHAANYMVFHTDAAEAMRIDSSGNVGIGTASPSAGLHVVDHETILSPDQGSSGGVASRALTIENINDTSWTACALTAYNATTSYDIRDRASYSFFSRPTQGNILTFAAQTSNNSTLHRFVNLNSTATEPLYRWDFFQYDGSGTGAGDFKVPDKLFQIRVREGVSNVEKFTIKGNGNVGIGTNNPLFKLHVNGDIYQDSWIQYIFECKQRLV